MRARDVMSSPVTTVVATATLLDAAKLLVNMRIGVLPVVDERSAVIGIVSEADLIRRVMGQTGHTAPISPFAVDDAATQKALLGSVADIMTSPVITATEGTALEELAAAMLKSGTKHIPILTGDALVGIVSRIDLVKAMLSRTPGGAAPAVGPPDDEGLRRQVGAAVEKLGIALGAAFDVVVRHGVAHLWGRVASEHENQACQAAAAKVPGILDVMSHMQVVRRQR